MWSGLGWAEPSAAVPRGGRAEPSREEARAAPGATRSRWAPAAGHPARVPLCAVPGWTRARALPRGRGPLLLPRSALGPPVPPPRRPGRPAQAGVRVKWPPLGGHESCVCWGWAFGVGCGAPADPAGGRAAPARVQAGGSLLRKQSRRAGSAVPTQTRLGAGPRTGARAARGARQPRAANVWLEGAWARAPLTTRGPGPNAVWLGGTAFYRERVVAGPAPEGGRRGDPGPARQCAGPNAERKRRVPRPAVTEDLRTGAGRTSHHVGPAGRRPVRLCRSHQPPD